MGAELKPFTTSLWRGEGQMSKYTDAVSSFACRFDLTRLPGIVKLCEEVYAFPRDYKGRQEIMETYARRTADEILRQKEVHAYQPEVREGLAGIFPDIDGCVDRALAASASLRCGLVPAAFVRLMTHSMVLFEHEGVIHIVNERTLDDGKWKDGLVSPIRPGERDILLKGIQPVIRRGRTYRQCLIGLDQADVGMRSIRDYWIASGLSRDGKLSDFLAEYPAARDV